MYLIEHLLSLLILTKTSILYILIPKKNISILLNYPPNNHLNINNNIILII